MKINCIKVSAIEYTFEIELNDGGIRDICVDIRGVEDITVAEKDIAKEVIDLLITKPRLINNLYKISLGDFSKLNSIIELKYDIDNTNVICIGDLNEIFYSKHYYVNTVMTRDASMTFTLLCNKSQDVEQEE